MRQAPRESQLAADAQDGRACACRGVAACQYCDVRAHTTGDSGLRNAKDSAGRGHGRPPRGCVRSVAKGCVRSVAKGTSFLLVLATEGAAWLGTAHRQQLGGNHGILCTV